jgi:heterodisulfide reductase subunit A
MEPRIGVFVCHCGTNIGGVVDVPAVTDYARGLDGVVFAEEGKWICSTDYLSLIKEEIQKHDLERVVIASCTPRTHEPLFKDAVKEGGLNPYLMEFVSIREQSSWVHKTVPDQATEKAKDLVRMGVAKAKLLEPAEEIQMPVGSHCLVLGGGIAGMTAALSVAEQGFHVHLVERQDMLGGILNHLGLLAPIDLEARQVVERKADEISKKDNITVYTGTEVETVEGYVGNYKVKLKGNSTENLDISQIIVATGMREIEPEGLFGYGEYPNVVTQLQFEQMLKASDDLKGKTIGIINCVGSRNGERGCCNVGCLASVRNAKTLKEMDAGSKAYIFYRDLNVQGSDVQYVQESLEAHDIRTVRYNPEAPPVVSEGEDGKLLLKTRDLLLGEEIEVPVDILVLTTGFQGDASVEDLKGHLKVSSSKDGFFQEAHIKLAPLDFANDGIYVCGTARSPKGVRWSMEEAMGAGMRASIPMRRGFVEAPGIISKIDYDACVYCGICGNACAFGAIEMDHKSKKEHVPKIIEALCKGCGTCASECPVDAMQIIHYSDGQIEAQVEAALEADADKKIVAFCCHWCAMGAVDLAGVNRAEYPTHARIIRVMCAGRVDMDWVQKSLDLGAAGVLVAGCEFPTCHYINGNYKCEERVIKLKKKLARKGYDVDKIWNVWMSAADGPKFVKTMNDMTEALGLR